MTINIILTIIAMLHINQLCSSFYFTDFEIHNWTLSSLKQTQTTGFCHVKAILIPPSCEVSFHGVHMYNPGFCNSYIQYKHAYLPFSPEIRCSVSVHKSFTLSKAGLHKKCFSDATIDPVSVRL